MNETQPETSGIESLLLWVTVIVCYCYVAMVPVSGIYRTWPWTTCLHSRVLMSCVNLTRI